MVTFPPELDVIAAPVKMFVPSNNGAFAAAPWPEASQLVAWRVSVFVTVSCCSYVWPAGR